MEDVVGNIATQADSLEGDTIELIQNYQGVGV